MIRSVTRFRRISFISLSTTYAHVFLYLPLFLNVHSNKFFTQSSSSLLNTSVFLCTVPYRQTDTWSECSAGWRPPQYAPAPCKLTFDRLTLKVVSESRVTWATSVPILVFLGLSVLDLGPMYATDRRQTSLDAHHHHLCLRQIIMA